MCNDCGEAVDIDSRFRQRTLRDRLIFGLEDQWKWYINFLPGGGVGFLSSCMKVPYLFLFF